MADISRIFIILGNACNFQCTYCLQHDKRTEQVPITVNSRLIEFLIEKARTNTRKATITFFGGEPLLYKSAIREIVGAIEPAMDKYRLNIITNGLLIDGEWVEYCNEHNFTVTISWDGYNVKETRGRDILAENWENISRLNRICILGTCSTKNYIKDFLDACRPYDIAFRKLHERRPNIFMEALNNKCHNCGEIAKYDLARVERESRELVDIFGSDDFLSPYYESARMTMKRVYTRLKSMSVGEHTTCGNGYNVVNVDVNGNLYFCHNDSHVIAHISDTPELIAKKVKEADRFSKYINGLCKDCEIRTVCRGFCPLLDDETKKETYCGWRKAMYRPFVAYIKEYPNPFNF